MATLNETKLAEAWRALDEETTRAGWKTLPIATNSTCLLLAGRHHPRNQESMLLDSQLLRSSKAGISTAIQRVHA